MLSTFLSARPSILLAYQVATALHHGEIVRYPLYKVQSLQVAYITSAYDVIDSPGRHILFNHRRHVERVRGDVEVPDYQRKLITSLGSPSSCIYNY